MCGYGVDCGDVDCCECEYCVLVGCFGDEFGYDV